MLDELLDDKGIVGLALKDSNFISILVLVILQKLLVVVLISS